MRLYSIPRGGRARVLCKWPFTIRERSTIIEPFQVTDLSAQFSQVAVRDEDDLQDQLGRRNRARREKSEKRKAAKGTPRRC